MRRLLLHLLYAFPVLFSVSAWAQAAYIRGQIFYEDGTVAHHIVVRLRSDKITYMDEQTTDPEGKFNFVGLVPSIYTLTIEGQNVKAYEKFIDISNSKMSFEHITLHYEHKPDAQNVPPEGAGATVSAHDVNLPAAARKEFETAQKLLNEKHDAENGIKHLRKAIDIYPNYAQAHMILGLTYLELQKPDQAQPELEKAAELDPQLPGAFFGLGTLYNQQKKFPEAAKALRQGLNLTPKVPDAEYQLAQAYFAMQRWDDAETHAHTVVSLAPQFAPVHIMLGNLALRKNDGAAAKAEFSEYLRLDPKGPMAAGATQMIQKIDEIMQK
jgi:tetratricopeptide (TPR) repeat protein